MIKKLFSFLIFASLLPSTASAFKLPSDRDGAIAVSVQDVGVSAYFSTGTFAPYLITGGTSAFADGSSLKGSSYAIYGILTSTPQGATRAAAVNSPGFVLLRSTDRANLSSELLVPPINIGTFISTDAVLTDLLDLPANTFIEFNPPIIAQDNLVVSASSNVIGNLATGVRFEFTVFYRSLNASGSEDLWIPNDDYQSKKAHDAGFYGVKPSSVSTAGGDANDGLGTEGWDFTNAQLGVNYTSTAGTVLANDTPMFLYGWSASTGTNTSRDTAFFVCIDTNSALGTATRNFLPPIYHRTLGKSNVNAPDFVNFTFPWPVRMERGLECQVNAVTDGERMRFYTRPARALR